jgi:hypothetical protein
MKTQTTTTERASFGCRVLFLLVLGMLSPATLVCAQTTAARSREPESLSALAAAMKEQQEQIRRQQKEIDYLKKVGALGTPTDEDSAPGTVVGSGTPIKHIFVVNRSLSLSPKKIGNGMGDAEFSLPGAKPGDLVLVTTPDVPVVDSPNSLRGKVTAENKVNVQVWNLFPQPPPGFGGYVNDPDHPYTPKFVPAPPMSFRIIVIGF